MLFIILLFVIHILSCAILRSSFAEGSLILRHILSCASSPTFLRSSFAHPSLKVRSSFGEDSY